MVIYNLTQHAASAEQLAAGVVDLEGDLRTLMVAALTFHVMPDLETVMAHSEMLATVMKVLDPDLSGEVQFMIGGAPYLMAAMVEYSPCYTMVFAYSERVSEEQVLDGVCRKVSVFKHLGFVPMFTSMS